jgi:hypothetical protein
MKTLVNILGALLCASLMVSVCFGATIISPKPHIVITLTPNSAPGGGIDPFNPVEGKADIMPGAFVVVYAFYGYVWHLQPYAPSEFTHVVVKSNGKWACDSHPGFYFVAMMVGHGYVAPVTMSALPKVHGPILAMSKVVTPKIMADDGWGRVAPKSTLHNRHPAIL